MCIYYGNSPELTYENREHVFPAGLGGKQRLAIGVVSDQANKLFSPMEMKLMRQSPVGLLRMLFGPGDRGSLSPEKASKSLVSVGRKDDGTPVLCYYSAGKPYGIPQVLFSRDTFLMSFPTMQENVVDYRKQFLEVLQEFDIDNRFVHFRSAFLSDGDILLGYHERKYYVASSGERPTTGIIKDLIQSVSQYASLKKADSTEHRVEQELIIYEDSEIARVYAKTAMNVLAHLKGADYAANPAFDHFRNWIITGEANEDYSFLPSTISEETSSERKTKFPPDSHWCFFIKLETKLEAIVCFYNQFCRRFTFGEVPNITCSFPFGYICDWKNEKEYTYDEYIEVLVKRIFNLETNNA